MSLKNLVTSLEVSKKLLTLGVKRKSFFKWYIDEMTNYEFIVYPERIVHSERTYPERYPAYTAQELSEILGSAFINISKRDSEEWEAYYQPETGTDNSYTFNGKNLVEVLGKILLAKIDEDGL